MSGFLPRLWIPSVLVVVIVVGGFVVIRIRDTFQVDSVARSSDLNAESLQTFNPKRIVYELTGTEGGSASINYLDENGQPNLIDQATLPWSFTVVTTLPSMSANLVAQASTDTGSLRCRVIVDGEVRDDRGSSQYRPFIYCLVKSV
ncbi:MmpS family transport accessory protein [Mycolicibacter minnesotensis]